MNTDELTRIYRSIDADDDTVRRVLESVRASTATASRRRLRLPATQWAIVSAVVLVVLIGVLVFVTTRPGGQHRTPPGHSTSPAPSVAPTAVLPVERPNTISGAVVDRGRPVPGASVQVALQPNQAIMSSIKDGQAIPQRNLPTVSTDPHGSFVVSLRHSDIVDPDVRESDYINFEIDVYTHNHMADWNETFHFTHNTAQPIRMVFDIGTQTITVNGQKSPLPVE